MTDIFVQKAPKVMADLMRDFGFAVEDAAAVLGNAGHESNGFRSLQEIKPVVAGSAGGWGWLQWTGPRRRAFDAYCKQLGLDPSSDTANYGWLVKDLKGDYKAAVSCVKAAKDLRAKVIAFEAHYLWAGVKHYDSRLAWAQKALAAFKAVPIAPLPDIEPSSASPSCWARLKASMSRPAK